MKSPLRYPGGKAKFFPLVQDIVRTNSLLNCVYCEPYAGGAGLALKLLSSGFTPRLLLNDLDESIYAFWRAALDHTSDLCELIADAELSLQEWDYQRQVRATATPSDYLKLGFSTFYLNRTSRSGILDGSGPIGGRHQSGEWKIDARFNKTALIESVRHIGDMSDRIEFTNMDALDFIKTYVSRRNHFTYLDPPYFVKGYKLYRNFYNYEDHLAISKELRRRMKSNWMLSYDSADEIFELYRGCRAASLSVNYSAGTNSWGSEVVLLSDSLVAPESLKLKKLRAA